MDTKQFFSKLDFDPAEIDELLDNILMDCPEMILEMLKKTCNKHNTFPTNSNDVHDDSNLQISLNENTNSLASVSDVRAPSPETKNPQNILTDTTPPSDANKTLSCLQQNEHSTEQEKVPQISCTESNVETEPIKFTPERSEPERISFKYISYIELPRTVNELNARGGSPGKRSDDNKSESYNTKSLLRELEEELERLNNVVNDTSVSPPGDRKEKTERNSTGSEYYHSLKRREESRRRVLHVEDTNRRRRISKERPHSAFEHSSPTGRNPDQSLSRYSTNIGEDDHEQDLARCFNLKGYGRTFSLGRHNQKHRNKKDDATSYEQKELHKNSSDYLFKDFKSWQSLQKHPMKTKTKKKMATMKSLPHNFRESSIESDSRSSLVFEELNTVLDQHLQDNSYFHNKIKLVPEVWNDNKSPSWCQMHMSRHEAVNYLRDKAPGSFVVRCSNSYKGAFGLVLKVDNSSSHRASHKGDPLESLVRNYLIEALPAGVRVKGSPNEPIFCDLASLVKEHCRNQYSLPCKLLALDSDLMRDSEIEDDSPLNLSKDILDSNETLARVTLNCSVLYLSSELVESLSEAAAVKKATDIMYSSLPQKLKKTTICQLKVTDDGLTLTDTCRSLFFRRYYPINILLYAGINVDDQRWAWTDEANQRTNTSRIFGIVTRKSGNVATENTCHLFAELDHSADEIVTSVTRLLVR